MSETQRWVDHSCNEKRDEMTTAVLYTLSPNKRPPKSVKMESKIAISTMPRPHRDQALGMLEAGWSARIIARTFGVHHSTVVCAPSRALLHHWLQQRLCQIWSTTCDDCSTRSCKPDITSTWWVPASDIDCSRGHWDTPSASVSQNSPKSSLNWRNPTIMAIPADQETSSGSCRLVP